MAYWNRILHVALNLKIDISDSRTVVRYAEPPYMTFSFSVVHVSTHKMAHQKETVVSVRGHNFPLSACMQL